MSRRFFGLVELAVAFVALFLTAGLSAQTLLTTSELQVQAAYLYKLGNFVTWPNRSSNDSFAICILGGDPFGETLDATVKGKAVNGQPLAAIRISNSQESSRCRVLFISTTEEGRLAAILTELSKVPVLTVSNIPHFVDRGGMIQFVLKDGRVRFEVNLASAEDAGLTLSSQLLKVAIVVQGGQRRLKP